MAKNKDNLLGTGGQRGTVSHSALRGGRGGSTGGAHRQVREHREDLVRRLREHRGSCGEQVPERESDDA